MSKNSRYLPRALPRRRFISLVGGGMVLAAAPLAGCAGGYPPAAVQAWLPSSTGDQAADVRRWMLAHALLAPNPHNRQPWLADLSRAGEITLLCDAKRLLPETDPFGRQILIGCGAFIELAVIAAAEKGHRVQVQSFPDGEPGPREMPGQRAVARLRVVADASLARDPLFAQIRRRHTNKSAYDNSRSVPSSVWAAMQVEASNAGLLAGAVIDKTMMAKVGAATRESYELESVTPRTWLESARLLRIGPSEIETHRDGISLMGTMPRVLQAVGMFDRFEVPARGTSGFQRIMDRWVAFETGSGYFWIASQGNPRSAQLNTGRAYVRAHLGATAVGVDMHPLSQALQEFVEIKAQYEALHRLLGFDSGSSTVQMLARVGYGTTASTASPRRDLGSMIQA